jgi:TonB family protein
MKKLQEILLAGALCCALALPALAQKAGPQFPFDFRPMGLSGLKGFGVTDDQIQQISQIYQSNRNNLIDLEADVAKRENDLRALLRTAQADPAQVERAVDALIEARGRLAKSTTMMMVRMRQLMTLDQWEKLSEYEGRLTALAEAPDPGTPLGPAPPPPSQPGVFRPGVGGVTAPTLIYKVEPAYSEWAKRQGIEGTVTMQAVIAPDGTVSELRVLRSLDPDLDQKAIEAVRQWRFQPGMKDGQPVPVAARIEVTFRLR